MRGRVVVVTGTGTEIGKTHVATALVRRASRSEIALGFKPIESGADNAHRGADGAALLAPSHPTFHVKPPRAPYVLRRPVSPHLAARDEGVTIDPSVVHDAIEALREHASLIVVELAGGLFSPIAPGTTNAELTLRLTPAHAFLVAPDRLGVLHDVAAAARAAGALGLPLTAVVLVAPAQPDASTGSNAGELPLVTDRPVVHVPRASIEELSRSSAIEAIYAACVA